MNTENVEDDPEVIQDFFDEYNELYEKLEIFVKNINTSSDHNDDLNTIFRFVHSIKSNLRMVGLSSLSDLIHRLENLLDCIRKGEVKYKDQYGRFTVLILDETKILSEKQLLQNKDPSDLSYMINLAESVLDEMHTDSVDSLELAIKILDPLGEQKKEPETVSKYEFIENDLELFHDLSKAFIKRIDHVGKNFINMEKIAIEMNSVSGNKVDPDQLQAAIYLSHLGVSLMPIDLVEKPKIDTQEFNILLQTPLISSDFLKHLPHWAEARKILTQFNENVDGSGTPFGIIGSEICDGAKILHIVISYIRIISKKSKEEMGNKGKMSAILEINKFTGTQFDEYWVDIFNRAIKIIHVRERIA